MLRSAWCMSPRDFELIGGSEWAPTTLRNQMPSQHNRTTSAAGEMLRGLLEERFKLVLHEQEARDAFLFARPCPSGWSYRTPVEAMYDPTQAEPRVPIKRLPGRV
jgi:hypothetical protein